MIFEIIFSTIVIGLSYYLIRFYQIKQLGGKFSGPKPVPFVGNMLEYRGKDAYGIFQRIMTWNQEYGTTVALYGAGLLWNIFITDPKDIEIVLAKGKTAEKSNVYKYFTPWLGNYYYYFHHVSLHLM